MEKVATDIYSFQNLRKAGYTYVDKTAMTTFLTDALRKNPLDFSTIDIDQSALEAYEPENPRLVALLYQTGYLTIKSFRQIDERNYADRYDFAGKTVRKLGISFSSEKRTIVEVKMSRS